MTARLNGEWPGERLRRNLPAIEPLPPNASVQDLARAFADIALAQHSQWPVLVDSLDWLRGVILAAKGEAEAAHRSAEAAHTSADRTRAVLEELLERVDKTERGLGKTERGLRKVRDRMSSSSDLEAAASAAHAVKQVVEQAVEEITDANMRRPAGLGHTDSDRPVTMKDLESKLTQRERDGLKQELKKAEGSLATWVKVALIILTVLLTAAVGTIGYLVTHPILSP